MSYKIVVDSCCELPRELLADKKAFERVPLQITVGDYHTQDDEHFNQKEFLQKVAECPTCPKSACPSPERFLQAYRTDAERVYVVTLSAALSGSYNSAVAARDMYLEEYGEKHIEVIDSQSASCGEAQIALFIREMEEKGENFEKIKKCVQSFRDNLKTYFVLDNLETLRKNGRLSGVKALAVSALNIKPLMMGRRGEIVQRSQAIGMKKALSKLADVLVKEVQDTPVKRLMITHCNAPERAELIKKFILEKANFRDVLILDTAGISSMYANDGGVIVTA